MRTITKLAAGVLISFAALVALTDYTLAAPTTSCVIRDNGPDSWNWCRIRVRRTRVRVERNWARVSNHVVVIANTGGNSADDNTGGDVDVDSGNVDVDVTIVNAVNQ